MLSTFSLGNPIAMMRSTVKRVSISLNFRLSLSSELLLKESNIVILSRLTLTVDVGKIQVEAIIFVSKLFLRHQCFYCISHYDFVMDKAIKYQSL